jgi:predicted metalloprotease with PDZ domain
MLARTLSCLAFSIFCAEALPAQSADFVHYTVAPVMERAALAGLAVEIRLRGDADGETRLNLPEEWAGTDSLWRNLRDLRVEGARSVRRDGPAVRVIAHAPGAPLVVRYRVTSAYAADPGFGFHKGNPMVFADWFFFHGEGVFAEPEGREDAPAGFAWGRFPPGWKVASDLDHLQRGLRTGTVVDIMESTAIGAPDLAVVEHAIGAAPLRVAVRGRWPFTPEEFAGAVAAIVRAEDAFWGDRARPFVVALAPLGGEGGGYSFSGTARGDAFSVASTSNFTLAAATHFLAHEYMHTWIAGQLGGLRPENEALGYWFSEGWTDFYAARVLLRAGVWTPADFVAELNEAILRNASSPARGVVGVEMVERFWTDPAVNKLPYDRGRLLALLLDYRVRRASAGDKNMDDVLRQMRAATEQHGDAVPVSAPERFVASMRDVFGVDVAEDLARHIDRAEPVVLPADVFGACATVETITRPEFSRGFDIEATSRAGNLITGLDPASPAYAAGLREGMRILQRVSGSIGDSSVELVYRMDDGGTERIIRYLPQGRATITFQRVTLAPGADTAECARVMSGA